jgi:hypothetical protein
MPNQKTSELSNALVVSVECVRVRIRVRIGLGLGLRLETKGPISSEMKASSNGMCCR